MLEHALETWTTLIPAQFKSNIFFNNFGYSLHASLKHYSTYLPIQSQK